MKYKREPTLIYTGLLIIILGSLYAKIWIGVYGFILLLVA